VVGTGPYKIQSVAPDFSTVTLVANKYHTFNPPWMANHAGVPYVSKIVMQHISSDSTAISELLAGGLDIASVPGAQLPRVQGNPDFVFKNAVTTGLWFVGANVSHPPFNNPQVRKALSESINKTALINVAYNGLARAEYTPMCSVCFFYNKVLKKYDVGFNPTDAKRIFAANHVTGPFVFATYGLPTYQAMAEAIQEQLASEGVQISIVAKPPADELALLGKGDFDIMLLNYIAADPLLIDDFYRSTSDNKSGLNFLRVNDAKLNQAFKAGLASLNQKKAQAAYDTAQQIMLTKYYMQPILTTLRKTAFRRTIKGIHIGFAGGVAFPDLYL
jgi:ABC-type transport system substrate-binding protein